MRPYCTTIAEAAKTTGCGCGGGGVTVGRLGKTVGSGPDGDGAAVASGDGRAVVSGDGDSSGRRPDGALEAPTSACAATKTDTAMPSIARRRSTYAIACTSRLTA